MSMQSCIRSVSSKLSGCLTCFQRQHQKHYMLKGRQLSTNINLSIYKLRSRGLIQVKGTDVVPFLQGLVTNDVTLLLTQTKAQYSMLLNVQGRVMYDMVLYNVSTVPGETSLLLECERSLTDQLIADMRKYKIRKKVSIDNVSEENCVLACFPPTTNQLPLNQSIQVADPRVPHFGTRIVSSTDSIESIHACDNKYEDESGYHERRLQWGIPEGPVDLPVGTALPLESNLVFMNGVSFDKGCYLGQELTARTHHTGVTRKRLMPLIFESVQDEIAAGETIHNEKNKNVGKFRSSRGLYGLGLLRIADVSGQLTVKTTAGDIVYLKAEPPAWWPQQ